MFDINRLRSQLLITGLQTKDRALYQFLDSLIRGLKGTQDELVAAIASGGTSNIQNITQINQQISMGSDDSSDNDNFIAIPGPIGPAGPTGQMGSMGAILFPPDAEDGDIYPPIVGPQGNPGPTGPQGPQGNPGFWPIDGEDGDIIPVPGPRGITGLTGSTGPTGPIGPGASYAEDGEDGEISYIAYPQPLLEAAASVYRSTNKTLVNNTETVIDLDTSVFDTTGFFSLASPTRLTVPAGNPGRYIVRAQVKTDTLNGTGYMSIRIYKNGSQVSETTAGSTGTYSVFETTILLDLVAGDYVEFKVLINDNGASPNTVVVGGSAATFFQISKDSAGTAGSGLSTLNIQGANVATSQTQAAGAAYGDLATAGPAVTLTTGTSVLIWLSCGSIKTSGGNSAFMSFAVSGATTLAASDANGIAISSYAASHNLCLSRVILVTGLTAGSNTFTAKYRNDGGSTWSFFNRSIAVLAL